MTETELKAAQAASRTWAAAQSYPRQGAGWPAGAGEEACEAILAAVDAAGRERHDPRQMVSARAADAADRAAWFAAAPQRQEAAAAAAVEADAAAEKFAADRRAASFHAKRGDAKASAWIWANDPAEANRMRLRRVAQ